MGGAIITEHLEALVSALAFLAQIGLYPVREFGVHLPSIETILGREKWLESTHSRDLSLSLSRIGSTDSARWLSMGRVRSLTKYWYALCLLAFW